MKILYGVCGDGYGHSSRALAVGSYLEKRGHSVVMLASNQSYEVLHEHFKTKRVKGPQVIFSHGKIRLVQTLLYNVYVFLYNLFFFYQLHRFMKQRKFDLVLNDFEPTASVLSLFYRIPHVSIDNQSAFTHTYFDSKGMDVFRFFLFRLIVLIFYLRRDHVIVTSLLPLSKRQVKKNTTIVSPLIRGEIRTLKPKKGKKILVYVKREHKNIISLLKEIDEEFVVFGYNKNEKDQNISFKTRDHFLRELSECKGVIGTAGFMLICESIYLDKPYFALPVDGYEQKLNANILREKQMGDYVFGKVTKASIEQFIAEIQMFKVSKKIKQFYEKRPLHAIDNVINKYEKRL